MAEPAAEASKQRGIDLFRAKRFPEAVEEFSAALRSCTNTVAADRELAVKSLCNRAMCHKHMSDTARVVEDCGAALDLDPECHRARYQRSVAHRDLGDVASALSDAEHLLSGGGGKTKDRNLWKSHLVHLKVKAASETTRPAASAAADAADAADETDALELSTDGFALPPAVASPSPPPADGAMSPQPPKIQVPASRNTVKLSFSQSPGVAATVPTEPPRFHPAVRPPTLPGLSAPAAGRSAAAGAAAAGDVAADAAADAARRRAAALAEAATDGNGDGTHLPAPDGATHGPAAAPARPAGSPTRPVTLPPAGGPGSPLGSPGGANSSGARGPCFACGRAGKSKKSKCTKCGCTWYCSTQCQKSHWKYHRVWCARQAKLRDAALAQGALPDAPTPVQPARRGKAGLENLGNTCFLNSALQCLSHTFPVTQHFLNDNYKNDINRDNPLGSDGKVADEYELLIKSLWFGNNKAIEPVALRRLVSRLNPMFSGHGQQDAEEFFNWLIDQLAEDLNRVEKKPYVEYPEGDGRPDAEVAAEMWDKYQLRNRSVFVEHMTGMYRNTMRCLTCGYQSVKFETFTTLPLEIPHGTTKRLVFTFYPLVKAPKPVKGLAGAEAEAAADAALEAALLDAKAVRIAVVVPKRAPLLAARKELVAKLGIATERLALLETYRASFYQHLRDDMPVSKLVSTDVLVAYEVEPASAGYEIGCVLHRRTAAEGASARGVLSDDRQHAPLLELFGDPVVVSYRPSWTALQLRLHLCLQYMRFAHGAGTGAPMGAAARLKALRQSLEMADVSHTVRVARSPGSGELQRGEPLPFLDDGTGNNGAADGEAPRRAALLAIPATAHRTLVVDWLGEPGELHLSRKAMALHHTNHSSMTDPSSDAANVTIDSCLKKHIAAGGEVLDDENLWHCSRCKTHVQSEKHFELWKLPNVLVVVLKRFEKRPGAYGAGLKIDMLVDFPLDSLDMSPYCVGEAREDGLPVECMYDLYGVVNHYGRMGFGHYTAATRDWTEDEISPSWFSFDDEACGKIDPSRIVSPGAYILCYRRRGVPYPPGCCEGAAPL